VVVPDGKVAFQLGFGISQSAHDRSAVTMLLEVPCSQWIDKRMLRLWRKPSALDKRSIEKQIPFRAIFTLCQA
jgi:hypothetical protein